MLSPLTKEQRMKVEENMGLVGKVIQDCVHTLGAGSMFDYDDLFQIGCLGLCKAAQTDKPGHTVAFSTYAYRLIRNEIYTELSAPPAGGGRSPPILPSCPARCWTMIPRSSGKPARRSWCAWSGRRPGPPA